MPTASNRLPMVPKLSSAASMPFPGATSSRAVSSSFLTSILRSPSLGPNDRDPEPRSGAQDHGVFEGPFSLGPYQLAALAFFFLPLLPAGLFFYPTVPVGVAHSHCLLAYSSLS